MNFAYLDAGSGSLILQALLGGIAGITVAWKAWRSKRQLKQSGASDEVAAVDEASLTSES